MNFVDILIPEGQMEGTMDPIEVKVFKEEGEDCH